MRIKTLLLVAFVAIATLGCSSDSKTLSIKPSGLDFNEIDIGDSVTDQLVLTNKYGKTITITSIILNGSTDFAIDSGGAIPVLLDNKQELTIVIRFTPISAGELNAVLRIGYDATTKEKEIEISGIGRPVARIDLSETIYDFGKKLINKSHSHDIDIENIGTSDLVINNFMFSGVNATLFSISAGGNVPLTITPGSMETITVDFSPSVLGNFTADLNITHNAVNESSPLVVPFSGEGIDLDPQITLSQSSPWDFGSVASTNPSIQTCEIKNTGIDDLTVSSATLAKGVDFTIDTLEDSNGNVINFPQVLAVNAKIFLNIKFKPTTTASLNDTLSIVHDGTNEVTPLDITLEGQGRLIIVKTFNYTGSTQQWTVPAGVTSISVEVYGAEAGKSTASPGTGGKGGKVTAKLTVQPGDVLNIYIGGKGGDGTTGVGGQGGWNGGGNGEGWSGSRGGGGGGGASDIRKNGTNLSDRIIIAGAGGGGGHNGSGEAGGHGGDLVGQKGANKYGGSGGTQSAGGAGGDAGGGRVAQPGSLGKGGGAWTSSTGGGGGAGYYGGGGGSYEAGGGGSSYTESSATSVVHTQGSRSGNGVIEIQY